MKLKNFYKSQFLSDPIIANINILRDFVGAKNPEKNATFATYGIITSFLFMAIDLIFILIWGYNEAAFIVFILSVLILFMSLGLFIRDIIIIRRFVKKFYRLDEAIQHQIQREWRRSIRLGGESAGYAGLFNLNQHLTDSYFIDFEKGGRFIPISSIQKVGTCFRHQTIGRISILVLVCTNKTYRFPLNTHNEKEIAGQIKSKGTGIQTMSDKEAAFITTKPVYIGMGIGVIAVLILFLSLNGISSADRDTNGNDTQTEVYSSPPVAEEQADVEPEQPMGDEAEYFAVDGQHHIVINARFGFTITLPNTWRAFSRSVNGDGYFITCENPNIDMRVYGINEAVPIEENGKMKPFVFDSGITGWCEEVPGESIMFSYRSDGKIISLSVYYAGEETWFDEHKETVITAAKTLRDGM